MDEEFLHFLWQNKFYKQGIFYTGNDQLMEVLHPGLKNSDAGPDFFNAKIKLDGVLWAGNVEIHRKASDWYRHNHHQDPLYDNVVLHVVLEDDREVFSSKGRIIPAWEMVAPEPVIKDYCCLREHKGWIPCERYIQNVSDIEVTNWIERMLIEKLERKVGGIELMLKANKNDWQEVFFIVLTRNFGLGLNGEPFELLARQTSWRIIGRNRDSQEKLEALLLGQAGFLDGMIYDDEYISALSREYNILKRKYNLESLPVHLWKFLRLRPGNFPTIRLVQLAALLARESFLFDKLLHCNEVDQLRDLFEAEPLPYWRNHYKPCVTSSKKSKNLGRQTIDLIIINTVVPLFFAFGKLHDNYTYQQKAFDFLASLPAEKNAAVRGWERASIGVRASSAAESQGLVYLKKVYCDHRKCLSCRIGCKVVSQNFDRIIKSDL